MPDAGPEPPHPVDRRRQIKKPLANWIRLRWGKRFLILKAIPLLTIIRLGLFFIPLKTYLRLITGLAERSPRKPSPYAQSVDVEMWALESVGKYILGDAPCLTQSLAAQWVLTRYKLPSELCIGVAKDDQGKFVAHAWVECDGRVVIGGTEEDLQRYSRLSSLNRTRF